MRNWTWMQKGLWRERNLLIYLASLSFFLNDNEIGIRQRPEYTRKSSYYKVMTFLPQVDYRPMIPHP